jgi:hypothetical protein
MTCNLGANDRPLLARRNGRLGSGTDLQPRNLSVGKQFEAACGGGVNDFRAIKAAQDCNQKLSFSETQAGLDPEAASWRIQIIDLLYAQVRH